MKKQDTAAFSLIRCDTEKKMPALAVRAIRAALFFAGLLAVAQGAAGIWTNYGWLWAAAGAAALVWQSVALGLPRRWLRAVLPLLCLICAAAFSRRFLAGAITVSSSAGETLTKATGHILLPLAGVGADAALFVAGRRRGGSQGIRSTDFGLWYIGGAGGRACRSASGRTGTAKRHIVFRVGRGLSRGAA